MYQTLTIAIADTQYIAREGLKAALSAVADFKIVAESGDIKQLLQWLKGNKPDVLIIDYHNPGFYSAQDISSIKQASPGTKILVISSDNNRDNIFHVLNAGIKNFLTKECSQEEIISAIRATYKGEKFFCSKVVDLILEKHVQVQDGGAETASLSNRETEVITLIANGLSNKEIAEKMHLSYHTITTHRKNIFKKLQIKSASELVVYAIRLGLLH